VIRAALAIFEEADPGLGRFDRILPVITVLREGEISVLFQ
jgi:hypothetical protein